MNKRKSRGKNNKKRATTGIRTPNHLTTSPVYYRYTIRSIHMVWPIYRLTALSELRLNLTCTCVETYVLLCVTFEHAFHPAGPIRPEITVKYIVVTLIFFSSGLSLKTEVHKLYIYVKNTWYYCISHLLGMISVYVHLFVRLSTSATCACAHLDVAIVFGWQATNVS